MLAQHVGRRAQAVLAFTCVHHWAVSLLEFCTHAVQLLSVLLQMLPEWLWMLWPVHDTKKYACLKQQVCIRPTHVGMAAAATCKLKASPLGLLVVHEGAHLHKTV